MNFPKNEKVDKLANDERNKKVAFMTEDEIYKHFSDIDLKDF